MLGYNKMTGYNIARYNADGTELSAADSLAVTGSTVTKSLRRLATDGLFLGDLTPTRDITGRILEDEIRLAEWISINKNPAGPWGD